MFWLRFCGSGVGLSRASRAVTGWNSWAGRAVTMLREAKPLPCHRCRAFDGSGDLRLSREQPGRGTRHQAPSDQEHDPRIVTQPSTSGR
jgi:hypothetical protein